MAASRVPTWGWLHSVTKQGLKQHLASSCATEGAGAGLGKHVRDHVIPVPSIHSNWPHLREEPQRGQGRLLTGPLVFPGLSVLVW